MKQGCVKICIWINIFVIPQYYFMVDPENAFTVHFTSININLYVRILYSIQEHKLGTEFNENKYIISLFNMCTYKNCS